MSFMKQLSVLSRVAVPQISSLNSCYSVVAADVHILVHVETSCGNLVAVFVVAQQLPELDFSQHTSKTNAHHRVSLLWHCLVLT